MHQSALDKFRVFLDVYLPAHVGRPLSVMDVGSCAIDGADTHRPDVVRRGWSYLGMDIEPGPNVDLVVSDGYDWTEIADDSQDVVLCSQVLEHTRHPWRLVQEIARVLRPRGLVFLAAPSAGHVHRYPEDCFRYNPDGLPALAEAAGLVVIDASVQRRQVYRSNIWRDAVAVAQKPQLEPEQAGRNHARAQLARLSMRADLVPGDLAAVDFAPRSAEPSQIATLAPVRDSAFERRDAELAGQRDPLRRALQVRSHLSAALKALTRPV
ncbi:class I SAM-dependent methyltransferase [Rhodopseudomonas sp. NSM]|uniref:class I SAM-dependent methyltransferase n=1 Tax=Rhodopseudomonas sp. NSM TaxID=3457630 RepID=UPI004036420D